MRRLSIYLFTDPKGIVDDYVEYFLADLSKNSKTIIIISLYSITKEGRRIFEKYSNIILVQNDGISIIRKLSAYNTGDHDELTFVTDSIMGPLFPMHQMFDVMKERNADIWGLVYNREPGTGQKYLPLEFISIKMSLLNTFEFKEMLKRRSENVVSDIHSACEIYRYFSDKGYHLDAFVNDEEFLRSIDTQNILYCRQLTETKKLPVFWKNTFTEMYGELLDVSVGNSPLEMYQLMETCYPKYLPYFWQHLLRTCHMCDLVRRLHLNYILPTKQEPPNTPENIKQYRIALLIHAYRPEVLQTYMSYLESMPENTDCYITTNTDSKKSEIYKICSCLPYKKVEVRVIPNRGRDVGSKLIGARDLVERYDLICCVHDKKTPHLNPQTIGEGFGYKCYSNVLFNKNYTSNIIHLFHEQPFLGLAVPPEPNHATMFTTLGYEWVGNYDRTKALAEQLNLNVPIAYNKEPVAPFGSFFWFRSKALKSLFGYEWRYEDFPQEPIADDGTILHAIERIYPYVAQQEGYYTAIIMADEYARIEFSNLRYYLRNYNKCLIQHGIINAQSGMLKELIYRLENRSN